MALERIHQIRLQIDLKMFSNVRLTGSTDFTNTDGVITVITCRTDRVNLKIRQTLMHKKAVFTNLDNS